MFTGEPLSENEYQFGLEELTFDDFPRAVSWNEKPSAEILAGYQVVIIGAGNVRLDGCDPVSEARNSRI